MDTGLSGETGVNANAAETSELNHEKDTAMIQLHRIAEKSVRDNLLSTGLVTPADVAVRLLY